jgi:hypothetical protein
VTGQVLRVDGNTLMKVMRKPFGAFPQGLVIK